MAKVDKPGNATTAGPLVALLEERESALIAKGLKGLAEVVDTKWAEVASSLPTLEALAEDPRSPDAELASILSAKVLYHLGELEEALSYALAAGERFDVNARDDFTQTILSKALDEYTDKRARLEKGDEGVEQPSRRLEEVVERLFERCMSDSCFKQAVGVALEASRLDKLEEAVTRAPDPKPVLQFALNTVQRSVQSRHLRTKVLRVLIGLYERSGSDTDHLSICQCHMLLGDAAAVANVLERLIRREDQAGILECYQVAFDLHENQDPHFSLDVKNRLEGSLNNSYSNSDAALKERVERLGSILSGDKPVQLHLDFLFSHNRADLLVIKSVKSQIDWRNSVCHSATVLANAIMHAGTTVDTFLRENLDWLAHATNWAKFSATAGLGAIHKGHLAQGKTLMQPYLPSAPGEQTSSPYSEGGALYALGIIYTNHGHHISDFIHQSLKSASSNETIQHGACLGLGLACLGQQNEEAFEDLKNVLYTDSAVAGEAAGIAMGMVFAGAGQDKAEEMVAYAHETSHEKIIRGVSLGLAILVYGCEDQADGLIDQLTSDSDPILRYGGAQALAMAYCGTASNSALRRLLHLAVADVADDVRRGAVMCLGFVLCANPEQCPRVVALLAESYNPHVRYGAAMAVGISCAGTVHGEAVALLEPLTNDSSDFVRQGALIAEAMVLMQAPPSRTDQFRKHLDKLIGDKHEETLCKMGAIIAVGILDAGGRNAGIQLRSQSGYVRRSSAIGLLSFTQYWFWYPLAYTFSLALEPTAFIGLNSQLSMPKFTFISNHKPSTFAYPAPLSTEKGREATSLKKAVLSTTDRCASSSSYFIFSSLFAPPL